MEQKNWRQELEPIIRQAGDIVLSYYGKQLVRTQKERHGFVTQADIASEEFLIKALSRVVPEASFWAEESGKSGKSDSEYCWVIDPLDGTTNFSYGLPYFCISIALTHHDIPQVGIIYQPLLNELFYAERGKGAFLNGNTISVSAPDQFGQALIAIGFPYPRDERAQVIDIAQAVAAQAHSIRHFGAIALDLAYIAAGRADGVLFAGLAWWDLAAGMLLIQEAGGTITDFDGNQLKPSYRSCLGASSLVYDRLKRIMADYQELS